MQPTYYLHDCSVSGSAPYYVLASLADHQGHVWIRTGGLPLSALLALPRLAAPSRAYLLRLLQDYHASARPLDAVCQDTEVFDASSFDFFGDCIIKERSLFSCPSSKGPDLKTSGLDPLLKPERFGRGLRNFDDSQHIDNPVAPQGMVIKSLFQDRQSRYEQEKEAAIQRFKFPGGGDAKDLEPAFSPVNPPSDDLDAAKSIVVNRLDRLQKAFDQPPDEPLRKSFNVVDEDDSAAKTSDVGVESKSSPSVESNGFVESKTSSGAGAAEVASDIALLDSLESAQCRSSAKRQRHQFKRVWNQIEELLVRVPTSEARHVLLHSAASPYLSFKLARRYPSALIVATDPSAAALVAQAESLKFFSIKNVVLCHSSPLHDPALTSELVGTPDFFSFQVFGSDFLDLFTTLDAEQLKPHIGQLLSLARVSFIQLPSVSSLRFALDALHAPSKATMGGNFPFASLLFDPRQAPAAVWTRIFESCLPSTAKFELSYVDGQPDAGMLMVELEQVQRHLLPVHYPPGSERLMLDFLRTRVLRPIRILKELSQEPISSFHSQRMSAISLYSLVKLGMLPTFRQSIFGQMISSASQFQAALVSDLIVDSSLNISYCPVIHPPPTKELFHHTDGPAELISEHDTPEFAAELAQLLARQLPQSGHFSFIEYQSQTGWASTLLSVAYPNATFISIEGRKAKASEHRKRLRSMGLRNNVVCQADINQGLTNALFVSPEFFQYQLISGLFTTEFLRSESLDQFQKMLGQQVATGITTFFYLPSSQVISRASQLLFRNLPADGLTPMEHERKQKHHANFNTTWEGAFLTRFLQHPSLRSVKMRRVGALYDGAWSVYRLDLVEMARTVNHHLYSERDGHERKYHLNYANTTAFLIRAEDKSRIPYDTFGISLISLLRLGLDPVDKDLFYGEFLKISLHEDMAPWNIQFRAGALHYVDKDSMHYNLDAVLPYAYQIILSLMNYKRSLEDFGHCGPSANIRYGVPSIGSCVGQSIFPGPCKDTSFPVPCADGSCKSTFLECLRDIRALEDKARSSLSQDSGVLPAKSSAFPSAASPTRILFDQHSF